MGDTQHLWTNCQALLQDQVSDGVWRSTFQDITEIGVTDGVLHLAVPNRSVKEKVEGQYLSLVENAVRQAYDDDLAVAPVVQPQARASSTVPDPYDERLGARPTELEAAPAPAAPERTPIGVPDSAPAARTFDDFVKGPSNQFAHAAALSVAGQPGQSYNPLFIYGEAGLGKTHLLQAIKHYVEENYPTYVVRYVTTETFLSEFIESIRLNTSAEFKRRYREVDVLLVDDIQFLENRKETQEEFFHTFNALHEGRRQLVLSSDRTPDAIPTLENRLRSRFKMGLITDIQPPDMETRLAVLEKKAEGEAFPVPGEVLVLIATNITENIRELEGALNRVTALSRLHKRPITLEEAEQHLHDVIGDRQPRPITPELILQATSEKFGFTIEEIKGKSRQRPLVTARQIAMYVFRDSTDLSYPAIAREFGGRDHTTVIHAVEKIKGLMGERRQIYNQVTELISQIRKDS